MWKMEVQALQAETMTKMGQHAKEVVSNVEAAMMTQKEQIQAWSKKIEENIKEAKETHATVTSSQKVTSRGINSTKGSEVNRLENNCNKDQFKQWIESIEIHLEECWMDRRTKGIHDSQN